MAENSQEALDELLKSLSRNNAKSIADEITKVIARGVTEEFGTVGKVKELSQRPLNSDEAYNLAVEMLIAFLEPAIMKEHALREIQKYMNSNSSLVWMKDFVEKSPVAPESHENISIPHIDNLEILEADLRNVIDLVGGI